MKEYMEPAIDLIIPERAQIAEILCRQSRNFSDKEIFQKRIEVVNLYLALCGKKETVKRSRTRPQIPIKFPITSSIKLETTPEPKLDRFFLLIKAT
jgi:hypothetical protein